MGAEPALLREALQSAADERTREKPLLEKEQRRLQVRLQNLKNDSRRLVDALAAGHGHEVKSITERLTQVDAEASDAERRLVEIRESLAQLELVEVDPNAASMAMMQFTPLWEALTANERTRLVNLLIERVDYDGVEQTIDVSFRPMGLATFAREATVSGELQ